MATLNSKTQNLPLITLVVPCYNSADTVEETFNSIKDSADSFNNACHDHKWTFEILFVEDGSSDNGKTINICKSLIAQNHTDNIISKVVKHTKNMGLSQARNTGIQNAKGKYITFIDSDDTISINWISLVCKTISQHKNPDIVVWGLKELYYDNQEKLINTREFVPVNYYANSHTAILDSAIKLEENTLFGYAWNKVYRLNLIKKNELEFQNIKMIEDVLFNIDVFDKADSLVCIDKSLHNYQKRAANQNSQGSNNSNVSLTNVYLKDYFDLFYKKVEVMYYWYNTNNALNDEVKRVLANEYSRYAFSAVWRNRHPKSGMDSKAQKKWITDFYKLELTEKLLDYIAPKSKLATIMGNALQSKNINRVYNIAALIDFVTNNFSGLLSKLRQSR